MISRPWIHRPGAVALLLAGVTFLSLLPFCNKAFHLDDPIFLWPARAILSGEPRPMSAAVNWYGTTSTLGEVTNHFPLVSVLMLAVASRAGFSEWALHLEFAGIAALAIAGMYALARPLCDKPVAATLLLLASPAFFVSATTVMADVPMLCFWIWSIVLWRRANSSGRGWVFLVAGILIALAALSKYPGIALVPLLAAAATSRRGLLWQIAGLAIPLAALACAQILTRGTPGNGMISVAVGFALNHSILTTLPSRLINGLSYTGGCFPAMAIVWALTAPRRQLIGPAVSAAGLVTLILLFPRQLIAILAMIEPNRNIITAHAAVFCVFGVIALWMPLLEWWMRRDRESLLLALWVFGVFTFAAVVNWTVNARSVLPMAPALAILAIRSAQRCQFGATMHRIAVPTALGAVLSFVLADADFRIAGASREAADLIHTRARTFHGTLWFTGHWGFQWYMEQNGAQAVDYEKSMLHAGDLFVVPRGNTGLFPLPPGTTSEVDRIELPVLPWVSTINIPQGALFYSSTAGPLPYTFAPMSPQRYTVYRVIQNILPPKTEEP